MDLIGRSLMVASESANSRRLGAVERSSASGTRPPRTSCNVSLPFPSPASLVSTAEPWRGPTFAISRGPLDRGLSSGFDKACRASSRSSISGGSVPLDARVDRGATTDPVFPFYATPRQELANDHSILDEHADIVVALTGGCNGFPSSAEKTDILGIPCVC